MDYIWDPHFPDRAAAALTKKKVGWTPDASEATEYDNLDEFPPSMNSQRKNPINDEADGASVGNKDTGHDKDAHLAGCVG